MAQLLKPTFSESWYRVAHLRAKLRSSAQISRQHYRGERWYVIRDPAGNQYHRLSDVAYQFVGLLDGTRTVEEAWDLVGGHLADEAPTQPEVIQILSQLHAANLLEADITPDADVLLRRTQKRKKKELQGRLMSVLFPRIPLWDPDRFLQRWLPIVRPLSGKIGALLWLAVVIGAIVALAPHWSDLKGAALDAINPGNWIYLWVVFVLVKLLHELGHGFACRKYGGEVHEVGIMFLVFVPVPYVDASSSWAFASKWARMFVGAAGMIVEVFIAALLAFVWLMTKDSQTIVPQLAYNGMLIASVSTLLFNANPLLRYDGYYILSDWLEIPNLRQKSNEYTLGLVKRHIFRVKLPQPLPPPMQRFWSVVYSIAAAIYRVFIGIMIALLVVWKVPILGILMAIGVVITFFLLPIFKLFKYLAVEPELHRKRTRAWAFTGAVAAAIVTLIGLIPFWVHIQAVGVVEPSQRAVLHTSAGGFVTEIVARDGEWLEEGDVILIGSDDNLDLGIQQLEADLREVESRMRRSFVTDPAQYEIDLRRQEVIRDQLADAMQRREALTIRAPIEGLLIAPEIEQLLGLYLPRGHEVATVAVLDELIVRATLQQRDAQLAGLMAMRDDDLSDVIEDPYTEIRLAGQLGTVLNGHGRPRVINAAQEELRHAAMGHQGGGDVAVDPRDPTGTRPLVDQFEVHVRLANPESVYRPGQRAYIRFRLDRKPLVWQWGRRFLQLVQRSGSQSQWR